MHVWNWLVCLPVEIAVVVLQASFLFHQAWASTVLLNPFPAYTWSLDKGPTQPAPLPDICCFPSRFPTIPTSYFPEEPRHPSLHDSIADPNTKRSHTFSDGNHAEPAGTFYHLSFHFELEMGLCSVFQAAGVENTLRVQSVKSWPLLALAGDIAQVFRVQTQVEKCCWL